MHIIDQNNRFACQPPGVRGVDREHAGDRSRARRGAKPLERPCAPGAAQHKRIMRNTRKPGKRRCHQRCLVEAARP